MSHSHTHAPGETQSHSHGPQPPQGVPVPGQGAPQLMQQMPTPDPNLQALIEQDFKPVDLKFGPPNDTVVLCTHGNEQCKECDVDFTPLNFLAKIFVANPHLKCPPPPQIVQQQRTQAVNKTKEDGNALFKLQKHAQAIGMYNMAANVAASRLPWETNSLLREELSMVLSNRSAAYLAAGDYISSLADANAVIQLKRPWSKGHFRKAKALVELGQLREAREAIKLGLQFEPKNTEMSSFLDEIEATIKQEAGAKAKSA